jgi:phage-related protein
MVHRRGSPVQKPKKRLQTEFYETKSGNQPVREFLRNELEYEERKAVAADIRTVEYGWPIGMPTCRNLGNGLLEVRTDLPGRTCRILFVIQEHRMVLLHGFIKKSQKTPQSEMDVALRRARNVG